MPRDRSASHVDQAVRAYRPLFARTGIGYDSHRFVPGDSVILGGVTIPAPMSLSGHSDADVVAHAVIDAVLGAAGAGDVGEMFPNTAEENAGRSSIEMLRKAVERVREFGFIVQQADVVVITEEPAIGPQREAMRTTLAEALGISPMDVSVKGKTNEGMGSIGRGEGLACIAVASLVPAP